MEFNHISVLKEESIVGLNIKPDGVYVDCTTGGAGHSLEIAKKLTTGRLICFDKDTDALTVAKESASVSLSKQINLPVVSCFAISSECPPPPVVQST